MTMNPLDTLIRAAIKVIAMHRTLKTAHKDGANAEAKKRYGSEMQRALEALDRALEAFLKGRPAGEIPPPFDWNGALKAGLAIARMVTSSKGKTAAEVIETIDATVTSSTTVRP